MNDHICGIDPKFINNKTQFQSLITEMTCPMCLNVVCQPLECKECQNLICENCYFILTIAEQTCITPNCKGKVTKANKFVREILCALKITCSYCNKSSMNYTDYLKHIEICEVYLSNPLMMKIKRINEVNKEIEKVQQEIQSKPLQKSMINASVNQEMAKKLITVNLAVDAKMELYSACIGGKLSEFKHLINDKKYPILEEISAKNYGWTAFHYAMHYGKIDIIKFIMDYLQQKGILAQALQLKSNDNRCPILCLLRSNSLTQEKKKEILASLLKTYPIFLTNDINKELEARQCSVLKSLFR